MPNLSSIDVQNPKKTIQGCFKLIHYTVPAFQREYVWEDNEIEQLLTDIEAAFENDSKKEYFLGTTVVYGEQDNELQLIDGQQRMTTFFLILCAIAKRYKEEKAIATAFETLINTPDLDAEGNNIDAYTLELQYEDSTKCLSNIWEDKVPDETDNLPQSSQRLYGAYNIISKRLKLDFEDFSEFKKFASYFINKIVFIQIRATNMPDALKIFETINQRGVTLNPMDLLKNMLFMHVAVNKFETLNKKWKSMVDKLEDENEKPLRFLRYYITATYDISDVKQEGIINEDEIYDWLIRNNDKCHYSDDPIGFTDKMISGLNRYLLYLNPDDNVQGHDYLNNIKALMGKSYRLHLVPLLSSENMNASLRARLFKTFELVIYYAVVNNIKSNAIERIFSSWCQEIRKVTNDAEFKIFLDNKVIPTVNNWNTSYKQNFMALSLNSIQKYKIKTILARLCKYVDAYVENDKDESDIQEYLKTSNEIEHIMPKKCKNISAYGIKDKEEYDFYNSQLGNLTLLEKTYNATIKNDSYGFKTTVYKNSKFYLTKSLNGLITVGKKTAYTNMNKKLKEWKNWDSTAIDERQTMLYELSKEIWDVSKL